MSPMTRMTPTRTAMGTRHPDAVPRPSAKRGRSRVSTMDERYPAEVRVIPRSARRLAHGAHLEAGVARVEHLGVDDRADVVRVPLLGTLGVLDLVLEGPGLVAGDGRANSTEDLAGDVQGLVRGEPRHHRCRVPRVHGVELLVLLGLLELHVLDDGARHARHPARG